jgi:hypothetical protein
VNRHQAAGAIFKQYGVFGACGLLALKTRLLVLSSDRGRSNQVATAEMLAQVIGDQFVMLVRLQRRLQELLDQG